MNVRKNIYLFYLFICSFFLFVAMQKEKTNQKRKTSYTKRNSKYFNGNFSATGCCKNCLKTQLFLVKVTTGACRPRTPCYILKNFLILHNKYYQYISPLIVLSEGLLIFLDYTHSCFISSSSIIERSSSIETVSGACAISSRPFSRSSTCFFFSFLSAITRSLPLAVEIT